MNFGMRPNKTNEIMNRNNGWKARLSPFLRVLLILMNCIAFVLLIWSFWPIPRQVYTIAFPATYWSEFEKQSYQFPTERTLTMDFPAYLKFGDLHEVNAILFNGEPITPVQREGCMDFCTLKHPSDANIWEYYNITAHFANDLSNIIMQPPGETYFPISPGESQLFTWQLKALHSGTAYLKNTVSLTYLEKQKLQRETSLIFAKELDLKVLSIASMSMPMLRILCLVLVLSSGVWFILQHASRTELNQENFLE